MKKLLLLAILLAGLAAAFALPPLPSCYHDNAEIEAELLALEAQYPALAKVHIIGYSELDDLPIYALKISDNVLAEEQEPAVLLIGQVHAEEVLGVETTMSNLSQILANSQALPYGSWISQLEMWFIPTINPEGLSVVTDDLDPSYRKNKRDNNNNGVFDFSTLVGYDVDGVDINRNFPFNWVHGDTLFTPAGLNTEAYDYYRGPFPVSESETRALMQFCHAQKPVFCIVWHSSRSGNLSEKVFYPLNWYATRPCPDLALGQQIGEGVAAAIIRENGSGGYEPSASEGRKGDINNWMYQQFGTICLVIECGTSNLQPDSTLMVNTVQRCSNGVWWLLNRALPFSSAVPSNSMLTGTIRNAATSQPLEAEIIVEQRHAPWFAPRKSDPASGRYWRPVSNGAYTLRFRKKGFADLVITGQNVNNGSWTTVNANLQPLNPVTLSGTVRSTVGGALIPARVILFDVENDTLQTGGEFIFNTYGGAHRLEVDAPGYYPYAGNVELGPGAHSVVLDIELTPADYVFVEDWENGVSNWVTQGPWVLQDELAFSGRALTDSWTGKGFYDINCDVHIRTAGPVYNPASQNTVLSFDQHLYTEFVYDSVRVEVSPDGSAWQAVWSDSGQKDYWHRVYIPMSSFAGTNLYLRFRLTDQSNDIDLTDPGWTLDNIRLLAGFSTCGLTPVAEDAVPPAPPCVFYPACPNPFRQTVKLQFSLAKDAPVRMEIYNLKGQKVRTLANRQFRKGLHALDWDGTDDDKAPAGSGIYLCRLSTADRTITRKLILVK